MLHICDNICDILRILDKCCAVLVRNSYTQVAQLKILALSPFSPFSPFSPIKPCIATHKNVYASSDNSVNL